MSSRDWPDGRFQVKLSARMISKADSMDYLLAQCPDFHTWWREYLEGRLLDEEPEVCLDLGEFASYVAELIERDEAECLEAAATVIERFITDGDAEVKEQAEEFLDQLIGSCDRDRLHLPPFPFRKPFRRFARYLGPKSLEFCRDADRGFQTWTDSDDPLLSTKARRMTREERTAICERFQRYCGETKYDNFLSMLATVCLDSGRLGLWQENLWKKFIATQGLNLSTEFTEVFGILEDELERMISRRAGEDQERRPEGPPLRDLISGVIGIILIVTLLAGAILASPVVWWFYGPLWAIGTAITSVILFGLTPFNHFLEPVMLVNIMYCLLAAGQFLFF